MSLAVGAVGAVITDANNNQVTVVTDGTAKRLQVQTQTAAGSSNATSIPGFAIRTPLASGATTSMANATGTNALPATYKYAANATRGCVITSLMTVFSIQTLYLRGAYFGFANALNNGLLYQATTSTTGTQATTALGTVKINEDWLPLAGYDCFSVAGAGGTTGYAIINVPVYVPLVAGSTDNVACLVRDNLANYNFYTLACYAVGYFTS